MKKKPHTALFMASLCILSSFILSTLTDFLGPIQDKKKEAFTKRQILHASALDSTGKTKEILRRFDNSFIPLLVDNSGKIYTFKEANFEEKAYLEQYGKEGFYKAQYKLFYERKDQSGFVIPIDGFGLWGPIHGYLALEKNGLTIEGLTFYDHMETPGLGAEISNSDWQKQFIGKSIYSSSEPLSISSSPFTIHVVKEAQKMELSLQESLSSVDAITGASVTSNGVQKAFEICLLAYRPLILKKNQEYEKRK